MPMPGSANIPVLDLSASPAGRQVESACRQAGCFNIEKSGIDALLTEALLDQMAVFFDLPDDHPVKREVHRSRNAGANGWTPTLEEPAYEAGTIALVESFDCVLSRERIEGLSSMGGKPIRPSIWPRLPGFRDVVRAHWDALITVAGRIYPLVSAMLRQEPGFLAARASSQALNTMRLLNYPSHPGGGDPISKGISAHTDFECITLIHQTARGLEVRTPSGEWIPAPVDPGQWTVLVGDMVERWSNGTIRATPHRVPTTPWPRRSIVMFLAADPGLEVRPLDAFVTPHDPPKFDPVTQDGLIDAAMARAEDNRRAMQPEVERIRAEKAGQPGPTGP